MLASVDVLPLRSAGMKWCDIADRLGVNPNTLRGKASRNGWTAQKSACAANSSPVSAGDIVIPASRPCAGDEIPISIKDANFLALGDLHVPHHNQLMLKRAIFVCKRLYPHIKKVIIGGDLFDFASLSQYPHNQVEADLNETVRLAGDVLRAMLSHFDDAYICNGNHDERFAKKLDRAWDLQLLINAALGRNWPDCNVHVTNLDYLYSGKDWLIGHPSSYSGQGGKTPADLADIHQKNVITFHNHILGLSPSKSGRYLGIDAGHMTEPGQHYYMARRLTKFTRWQSGFVIVSNGYPYLYTEAFTDWQALEC